MKKLWAIAAMCIMCVPIVWAETQLLKQGSTISVSVNEDRGGIIQNAFTANLSAAGFTISSTNPDYLLNVTVTVKPLIMTNSRNQFATLDLTANILDNNGKLLLPYTFTMREGHISQASADDRVVNEAVKKINEEYSSLLNGIIESEHTQPVKQGNTFSFRINADRDGIIQNAFTAILSDAGLKAGSNNTDYLLTVDITITPLDIKFPNTEFVRIDLLANLLDRNGKVLLPYTISRRVGYQNQAGAADRALSEAVTVINAEYRNRLNEVMEK